MSTESAEVQLEWPQDRNVTEALEKHLAFLARTGTEIFPDSCSGGTKLPHNAAFLDSFLATSVHPHLKDMMSRCAHVDAKEFQRYIRFTRLTAQRLLRIPPNEWDDLRPWSLRLGVVAALLLLHHYCAV
jgi:hypothetical protein